MHALRHFHASVLLSAGVPVKELADYPAHGDPTSPFGPTPTWRRQASNAPAPPSTASRVPPQTA
jgi:hypothetical protein